MSHETVRRIHGGGFEGAPPPETWSYTRLRTVESCPRRYWLQHATYDFAKSASGYPRRHTVASVLGITTHRSIEMVLNALRASPSEPAVAVLRELGGLREIVQAAATDALEVVADNPRMHRRSVSLRHAVERRLDSTVTLVQLALRRVAVGAQPGLNAPSPKGVSTGSAGGTLGRGSYTEIRVEHAHLAVGGVIDHLQIDDESTTITDFKTGTPSADHLDQLLVYGVTWRGDPRNPSPNVPMTLVAEYGDHRTATSVDGHELDDGEETLKRRLRSAVEALAGDPPATLTSEVCGGCEVRHLCDDYWSDVVAPLLTGGAGNDGRMDVSGVVIEARSPTAYLVQLSDGTHAALFSADYRLEVGAEFRAHDLRRLPADRTDSDEPALQVTNASELFVLG